jgi:hypothetical protein
MGSMFKYIKILIIKLEGKRTLGGFRYRCKGDSEINIREMGCEYVGWFPLAMGGFQKWLVQIMIYLWCSKGRSSQRFIAHPQTQ